MTAACTRCAEDCESGVHSVDAPGGAAAGSAPNAVSGATDHAGPPTGKVEGLQPLAGINMVQSHARAQSSRVVYHRNISKRGTSRIGAI